MNIFVEFKKRFLNVLNNRQKGDTRLIVDI